MCKPLSVFISWCSLALQSLNHKASQNRKIWWLDEDEKPGWTYFSSDKKRLKSLRWWTFYEVQKLLSGLYPGRMSLQMRLGRDSVISSAVPLRSGSAKGSTVDFWKSPGPSFCCKSGVAPTTLLAFYQIFAQGGSLSPQVADGKNELQALFNVLRGQRAFWSHHVLSMLGCVGNKWSNEKTP